MSHKSWPQTIAFASALFVVSWFSDSANAQSSSLFGASGPVSGNNGFQSGAVSIGQQSGSSSGGLSLPANSLPSNAMPGQSGTNTGLGTTGTAGQRNTMVGQTNTRFVGNAQAGTTQPGMQGQNNRQGQNRNRAGQQANQNNQAGGNNNNQQTRTVRPQLRVSIDYPKPSAEKTTTSLSTSFQKLSARVPLQGVTVEADGGIVTLRGNVDTEDTRRLAAAMARLEPGVRKVKNEITIGEEPAPEAQ